MNSNNFEQGCLFTRQPVKSDSLKNLDIATSMHATFISLPVWQRRSVHPRLLPPKTKRQHEIKTKVYMIKFILTGLFLLQTALAQAIVPVMATTTSNNNAEIPFSKSFDIEQLASPKTPQEFLKLLRLISENFLLLDPDFQKDALLLRLFGPGEISDPYAAYPKRNGLQNKGIDSKSDSLFKKQLKINGIGFNFATFFDQTPAKRAASLGFMTSTPENPFTAELIAIDAPSNANWRDPLSGINAIASHENIDAAGRRPLKTHPKGYFWIDEIHENNIYISKLNIELNGNGTVRHININQKEK